MTINCLEQFTKSMEIRRLSPRTITSYLNALNRLAAFCTCKALEILTDDEVQDHIYHLVGLKLSWSYINVQVSAYRFFYGITLRKNLRCFIIPCPKARRKLPLVMSRDEIKRALAAVQYSAQQSAFFHLLIGCGLRGGEACRLRLQDLDKGNQKVWVRAGKGGKDRGVYFPPEVRSAFVRYYKQIGFKDYVFPGINHPNQPMTEQRARDWFREVKVVAGIQKRGSLHMWRHTYATQMLENGHDLLEIKRALGHTSLQTTMIYLHISSGYGNERDSPLSHLDD